MAFAGREALRSLPRFHVLAEQITGGRVNLEREQAHKIRNVLRLREGSEIAVLDGTGSYYRCRLIWLENANVSAEVLERGEAGTEAPIQITLAQAIPKQDKMDLIIQSCTEAGVCRFLLFESRRCVARWPEPKIAGRIERLQKIAHEAAEQSLRAIVPEVRYTSDVKEVFVPGGLLLYEGAERRIGTVEAETKMTVIVGPEGGFDDEEASSAGCIPVSLGPRLLRTEHAGLYAVAAILQ